MPKTRGVVPPQNGAHHSYAYSLVAGFVGLSDGLDGEFSKLRSLLRSPIEYGTLIKRTLKGALI